MSRTELADAIYAQDLALYTYTGDPDSLPPVTKIRSILMDHGASIPVYGLFNRAVAMVFDPVDAENRKQDARYVLTQSMLRLVDNGDISFYGTCNSMEDDACMEAELRFVRSLERHSVPSGDDNRHKPAAILRDTKGLPFAYLKAGGHPTALAWRESTMTTAMGDVWIPGGAIFSVWWDGDPYDSILDKQRGAGIIDVMAKDIVDGVVFRRMSTWCVTDPIRLAAAEVGGAATAKLKANIDGVMERDLKLFGDQVCNLIEIAIPVNEARLAL